MGRLRVVDALPSGGGSEATVMEQSKYGGTRKGSAAFEPFNPNGFLDAHVRTLIQLHCGDRKTAHYHHPDECKHHQRFRVCRCPRRPPLQTPVSPWLAIPINITSHSAQTHLHFVYDLFA